MAEEVIEESSVRRVTRLATIRRPASELFDTWRELSRLPTFMRHVKSIHENGNRSHWVVRSHGGDVEWDAELTINVRPNRIAWRSLEGADIPNTGDVTFQPALQGRGTEMRVTLTYDQPAGVLGELMARLTGDDPQKQLDESVMLFRMLLETGHIATTDGQSHGGPERDSDRPVAQAEGAHT